jgi:hypothetical protein
MTEHISESRIERFCISALPEEEVVTIANHLAQCQTCHQSFAEALRRRRGSEGVSFTLAPEFWLRHEHIDYEQLVGLVENKLAAADREIIDAHLSVCASCQDDVRNFLAFRKEIEPELHVRYDPLARETRRAEVPRWSWWPGLAWKPTYAAAVVVIGIALVIGAAFFLKRTADNFQAKQTPTPNVNLGAPGQTPIPDNRAANGQSPTATPNESPVEKPSGAAAVVALNDRPGIVTVDKNGNVAGLDDVPAPTRDEIAKVLLSERLEQPAILKELGGQEGSLRGSRNTSPFRLTSPLRTVIVTDRPTLKWEKASGASSYRVYVNDQAGHEVARSEDLPSERTGWILPKPLKRGEIYVWTVMAVVDGKEIISPGPSSPEMKFQVLPISSAQQLYQLKKARSHLALGIFYTKVGMIVEAEREFQELARLNPNAEVVKKLLRSSRLIRRTRG